MSLLLEIKKDIENITKELYNIEIDSSIEQAKTVENGDFSSTVAFLLAKKLKKAPNLIANEIVNKLIDKKYQKIEVLNGFINIFIDGNYLLKSIKKYENSNFEIEQTEKKKKINIEFVSANPTGDLHIGHARQAALGDSIARLLSAIGHEVVKEYYINDAGVQIDNLGKSVLARIKELLGEKVVFPADGYHGEDIVEIAKKLLNIYKNKYSKLESDKQIDALKNDAMILELDKIKEILKEYNVQFDIYSSELEVRRNKKIEEILEIISKQGKLYQVEGATWFKTTDYGDDKDRVLIKSDGNYTYFTPDIAYHKQKTEGKYDLLIDILGADHYGYLPRMLAAIQVLGYQKEIIHFEIVQMVRLYKDGAEFKLSKRSGNSLTIRDLIDEIGVDAARYVFVSKSASSHMDIDLNVLKATNDSNPVYYIQYAHSRIVSVLALAEKLKISANKQVVYVDDKIYSKELMRLLLVFDDVIKEAATSFSPYKITLYLEKLAKTIHTFYSNCSIIKEPDKKLASYRLYLMKVSMNIIKRALNLLGVNAPNKM